MSDGVEIAYLVEEPEMAASQPPVLLIHGFASNIEMNWVSTGWVRDLTAAGHRVIAIDNRGHGKSQKLYETSDYSGPLMAGDALRLLDHLKVARAHVIGYSMGARITAFFAIQNPERVASVVFGGMGGNMVRPMAGTGPIAHALEAAHIDEVKNPTARTFRAFAEQTGSDLKALAVCIRSGRVPLTPEAVSKIACPVLVAVGSEDVIGGSAAKLAEIIPGAIAFEIAGREHMKAVGDRTFKAEVLRFLKSLDH